MMQQRHLYFLSHHENVTSSDKKEAMLHCSRISQYEKINFILRYFFFKLLIFMYKNLYLL